VSGIVSVATKALGLNTGETLSLLAESLLLQTWKIC